MRLGLILLDNVVNVNMFDRPNAVYVQSGNQTRLYFMLIGERIYGKSDSWMRWIPSSLASISVDFRHIDSNKEIVGRNAVMAYPSDDRSIWYVDIGATETIAADSLEATLTDGAVVTKLTLLSSLRSEATASGLGKHYC